MSNTKSTTKASKANTKASKATESPRAEAPKHKPTKAEKAEKATQNATAKMLEEMNKFVLTFISHHGKDRADKLTKRWHESQDELSTLVSTFMPKPNTKRDVKPKDKNAPKAPLSAYMCFAKATRDEYKEAGHAGKEIMVQQGAAWKTMSDKEKKKYAKQAEADKERYEAEKANYKPDPEFVELLAKYEAEHVKVSKRAPRDPDAPKGARSAYMFYSKAKRDQIKAENPDAKASEISKLVSAGWKELSERKKSRYVEEAKADTERYNNEMSNYIMPESVKKAKEEWYKTHPVKGKAGKGKAGKGKAVRDPTKPKAAHTAYFYYCEANRAKVAAANPEMSKREVNAQMSEAWKELKQAVKDGDSKAERKVAKFNDLALEDKGRFTEEMKSYKPANVPAAEAEDDDAEAEDDEEMVPTLDEDEEDEDSEEEDEEDEDA